MKIAVGLMVIIGLGGWQAWASPPEFNGHRRPYTIVEPVRPAPVTPMYLPSGGITNLTRYRGQIVLLNLWATWCAPCRAELPHLEQLQKDFAADGLVILALATDDAAPESLVHFLQNLGIRSLSPLSDPAGRAASAFGTTDGLPWSFIIDRQGRLRGYMPGAANWNGAEAHRLLKYYLAQP